MHRNQSMWIRGKILQFVYHVSSLHDAEDATPSNTTVVRTTPTTSVSNTQGNGHAPLKPVTSGSNLQQRAKKEQHTISELC